MCTRLLRPSEKSPSSSGALSLRHGRVCASHRPHPVVFMSQVVGAREASENVCGCVFEKEIRCVDSARRHANG